MKLNTVLSIFAVISALSGLGMLLVPTLLWDLYGTSDLTAGGIFLFRFTGAMAIGVCVIAWFARNAEASPARNGVVLGLGLMSALGAILALIYTLNGTMSAVGWADVVIYALFTIGFLITGRAST